MIRLTPAYRITLGLLMLTASLLLGADMVGLLPNPYEEALDARKKICESLAIYGSLAVERNEVGMLESAMEALLHRHKDVLSAALRTSNGTIVAQAGERVKQKITKQTNSSTPSHLQVPIFKDKVRWGTLEVRFEPIYPQGIWGLWARPIVKLMVFFIPLGFIGYLFFMKKTLKYLDPSSVIPGRVKATLDTLAEGVVVLDNQERIVLANSAFAEKVGQPDASLLGTKASELKWTRTDSEDHQEGFPWTQVISEGQVRTGVRLALNSEGKDSRSLMFNGAPILDGEGKMRGALATFDDVTLLEKQNIQLQKTLDILKKSRKKVRDQNRRLKFLATQDPMTQCLNRRSFFEIFEDEFSKAQQDGQNLSCIMVDIDKFKSINDRYGHLTGDKVIQRVAEILRATLRANDAICRYGGEEFCILLPNIPPENAVKAAERYRLAIESEKCEDITVTVSLGVSSLEDDTQNHQELLSQADQALYQAKSRGRNSVVCWGHEGESLPQDHAKTQTIQLPPNHHNVEVNIRK